MELSAAVRQWESQQFAIDVNAMHDPILVLDAASRIVVANDRLLTLTGFSSSEVLGRRARILFPAPQAAYPRPDPVQGKMGMYRGAELAAGTAVDVARKDGSVFAARLCTMPATGAGGEVRIITVRPDAQLTLAEIGLGGLLESAPDATLILDPDCRVVLANTRAHGMFARDQGAMDGDDVSTLIAPSQAQEVKDWLNHCYLRALAGDDLTTFTSSFPVRVHSAHSSTIPVEVAVSVLHLGDGMLLRAAFRDITERIRLQEEAEQMKNDFFATVSHELRTPLTSVVGFAELLEDAESSRMSSEGQRFLEAIQRNAQRELSLVDDLLMLVSIGGGQLPIRPHRFNLWEVMEDSVAAFRPAAEAAHVQIVMEEPSSELVLRGDASRLRHAFDNVISNAIKFSPLGEQIIIRSEETCRGVRIAVIDRGPGIPATDRTLVFERLYRGAHAIKEEKPGAGLGLTIVKAVIDAHQGSIAVSDPCGGGTSFEISLPREA